MAAIILGIYEEVLVAWGRKSLAEFKISIVLKASEMIISNTLGQKLANQVFESDQVSYSVSTKDLRRGQSIILTLVFSNGDYCSTFISW